VIVVLRVDVRPQPRDAKHELARRERLLFDLPDREVWVTSTRSSSAGVHDPEIDSGDSSCDEHESGTHRRDHNLAAAPREQFWHALLAPIVAAIKAGDWRA
jgi:hypothetical protein